MREFETHPIWATDEKLKILPLEGEFGHPRWLAVSSQPGGGAYRRGLRVAGHGGQGDSREKRQSRPAVGRGPDSPHHEGRTGENCVKAGQPPNPPCQGGFQRSDLIPPVKVPALSLSKGGKGGYVRCGRLQGDSKLPLWYWQERLAVISQAASRFFCVGPSRLRGCLCGFARLGEPVHPARSDPSRRVGEVLPQGGTRRVITLKTVRRAISPSAPYASPPGRTRGVP